MKRLLTWVLTLMMIFTMLPGMTLAAFAAETIDSGDCGDNLTWTLDSDGLLTISGTGEKISFGAFMERADIVSVTMPSSVTSIDDFAFYNCGLTSVTIPDSVTSISNNAFSYCTRLTSVTIGNGVTSIGNKAFEGCTGLTSVTMGNSVTSIGNYAFYDCGLTSVTIPDSVTSIGGSAFYGCASLTSVTIGNGVTSIGGSAFYGCTGLTSVTMGNGVKSIGSGAFYGCTSLTGVTIPDSVTNIGNSAFEDCTSLTSVTMGNGVTSIGDDAFYNCTGLTSVTIPDSVTSIGDYAFYLSGLTSVTIPDSVKSIGNYAFAGCASLTSATIGNGVTSISNSAFSNCQGLTSVTIGNSVTSIGDYAFYGCTGLTSVTIPDSVTSIGNYAFSSCIKITALTIGKSVTSIGESAFYDCNAVKSVGIPCSLIDAASLNVFDKNIITVRKHFVSEAGGTCSKCQKTCGADFAHDFDENKKCSICGFACGTESNPHDWSNDERVCVVCGFACNPHDWSKEDGICAVCGLACNPHDWSNKDGICAVCSYECPGHEYNENYACETCGVQKGIVINMTDAYGDGWNGAAIQIYKDGELVGTATFSDGYSATGRTDYDPHSTYTFKWVKGYDDDECSFEILVERQSVFSATTQDCRDYTNEIIFFTLESTCEYSFNEGSYTCSKCQKTCGTDFLHKFDENNECTVCHFACGTSKDHDWSKKDGICAVCGFACNPHDWSNDERVCAVCGFACGTEIRPHDWSKKDGVCAVCDFACNPHDWSKKDGICAVCGLACNPHEWSNDERVCAVCGFACGTEISPHDWSNKDGICAVCSYECPGHEYNENYACETCGVQKGIVINMTDAYGDGWNGAAIQIYKDGELVGTATFSNGYSATGRTDYDPHSTYTFKWVEGYYDDECSFEILVEGKKVFSATGDECRGYTNGAIFFTLESTCEYSFNEGSYTCSKCQKTCGTDFAHDFDENKKCSICGFACGTESNPHDWSNKDGICAVCSYECPKHEYDENNTCETCGMKSEIVINMADFYGDGWTGAAIEIYKDGELVGTATFSDGYSATGRTDYDPHSTYTFQWVKGDYDDECSFEILVEGQRVFSATGDDCENFTNGQMIYTLESTCEHSFNEGSYTCSKCQKTCGKDFSHEFDENNECTVCHLVCGTESIPHDWSKEDGICAACGVYEPATPNAEGYYEIGNAGQLYWFAEHVNSGNKSADAILLADIDLNGHEWTTICSTDLYYNVTTYDDAGYTGTFDGNNHVIKNLALKGVTGKNTSIGFIGTLSGKVKNLGIETVSFNLNGATDIRAAAIVGQIIGGTVSDCYVKGATITPNSFVTGGIAGCNYAGTIENCYVVESTISGTSGRFGYIVGDNRGDISENDRKGTVNNCYTDASAYVGTRTGTETNCEANVSAERFTSGEVAYKLGEAWGQNIGTDETPVLGGEKVYLLNGEYINANQFGILSHGTVGNQATATVLVPTDGTYTVIFVDYGAHNSLNQKEAVTFTADKAGVYDVTAENDITLDAGDKIMVWSDNFQETMVPMCKPYILN